MKLLIVKPQILLIGALLLLSCGEEPPIQKAMVHQNFPLHIRMKTAPDRLHPMLSKRSNAAHIEKKIFYPLLQIDPDNLKLKPLLARDFPTKSIVESGELKGDLRYKYEILPDAEWEDGMPVTAADYLFTVKASQDPLLQGNQWKTLLESIDSVILDDQDPKAVEVLLRPGVNADIVAGNFELYPEHHYDSLHLLRNFTLRQLKNQDLSKDSALLAFSQNFSQPDLSRNRVMGCGPYTVSKWEEQQLVLRQKTDWWGDKHASSSRFFKVNPGTITYHFIPDQTTSIALLKSGKIDQISDLSPSQFNRLKNSSDSARFGFYTPVSMRYYMIAMNNLNPALRAPIVRKALARCTDTKSFIDKMLEGLATPITGPIYPSKSYAIRSLQPVKYDLNAAAQMLHEAGWKDTNGDGILDKMIQGKRISLDFEILITGSTVGKNLALLLRQDAAKIGINIRLQPMRMSAILNKVVEGKYDLAALAFRQSPGYDQMKQTWHSQSTSGQGKNYFFYNAPQVDRWTDSLTIEQDTSRLNELYHKIQRKIYEDQPVIFLCAPLERIVVSDKFRPYITPLSPGYVEEWYQFK